VIDFRPPLSVLQREKYGRYYIQVVTKDSQSYPTSVHEECLLESCSTNT
jgi:hypothetical protein